MYFLYERQTDWQKSYPLLYFIKANLAGYDEEEDMLIPNGKEREAVCGMIIMDISPVRNGMKRAAILKRYRMVGRMSENASL